MTGNIYKLKAKFHDPMDDEYIVVETLNNIVALMNNRTNYISWCSKHAINLEFDGKPDNK